MSMTRKHYIDIVTRLRLQSLVLQNNKYFAGITDDLYAEAADEIERLRVEIGNRK